MRHVAQTEGDADAVKAGVGERQLLGVADQGRTADSLGDAAEEALEAAKSVEGYQVSFDEAALEKLMETIQDGRKLNLDWGKFKGESNGQESRTAS